MTAEVVTHNDVIFYTLEEDISSHLGEKVNHDIRLLYPSKRIINTVCLPLLI